MPKFTAQYPQMEVHRADCADLAKKRNVGETRETREAASVAAFVADQVKGELEELGYGPDDFRVLGCAR